MASIGQRRRGVVGVGGTFEALIIPRFLSVLSISILFFSTTGQFGIFRYISIQDPRFSDCVNASGMV